MRCRVHVVQRFASRLRGAATLPRRSVSHRACVARPFTPRATMNALFRAWSLVFRSPRRAEHDVAGRLRRIERALQSGVDTCPGYADSFERWVLGYRVKVCAWPGARPESRPAARRTRFGGLPSVLGLASRPWRSRLRECALGVAPSASRWVQDEPSCTILRRSVQSSRSRVREACTIDAWF